MNHNPNCDGDHCNSATGQVRVLPTGSLPHHGNMILCQSCFRHELAWRVERNTELAPDCAFKLPTWESLKVYGEEEPQPLHGRNSHKCHGD